MLTARDIMTEDVETVQSEDDVASVLTRLARANFDGYPVVDERAQIVGIVTMTDLVDLFQPSDRTLWIPVGFPPFLESLTYAVDLSWDELDVGIDLVRAAGKPISEVMTQDVVTVAPDTPLEEVITLLADEERDINRLPVVVDAAPRDDSDRQRNDGSGQADRVLVGIVTRQDVLRALRDASFTMDD